MTDQNRTVFICRGTGCESSKSPEIERILSEGLEGTGVQVKHTGCHGMCQQGPIVIVEPEGLFYANVGTNDVPEILGSLKNGNKPIERLSYLDPTTNKRIYTYHEIPFYKKQKRLVLHNCGHINPEEIADYLAEGGYQGLKKALFEMTPDEIVEYVKGSGLRGRGGGGFTTGLKWQFCKDAEGDEKFVLCNADEGDPGAFMDRSVLEGDPHAVLEGMIIAGIAIGARQGYVYCRAEYPLAIKRLRIALQQAREKGYLGQGIMGSQFDFDIDIFEGAGAFVCGEETALIASIEGKRGMPRSRPPYPAQSGLYNHPTLLNNVKTYANVPLIIKNGAEWFADIGTQTSKGTAVFALTGKIANSGLVEVPMGVTLREVIFDIGGGVLDGKQFKAVQTGGPSGGCLPASYLDSPVDYDSLVDAGTMMGSGGMVVLDEDTCMVDVARYFLDFTERESCGKCVPCRLGTKQMLTLLEDICAGRGQPGDIELLEELAQGVKDGSLCGLGQSAPNPVLTTIRYFREEYEQHIYQKHCAAGVCTEIISSPCQNSCPIDTEAPLYLSLTAQERFEEAFEAIIKDNPLPTVCGRVCNAPCESQCKAKDGGGKAIAVREIKKFLTDYAIEHGIYPKVSVSNEPDGAPVAIVGSGPAGLTAGYYLANMGYKATIFEAGDTLGGALTTAIPAYRLPHEKLQIDLDHILSSGVKMQTNTRIGEDISFKELRTNFSAVFVASGADKARKLRIRNEDAEGVLDALEYLEHINLNKPIEVGKRVGVIGGGNTAVDSARVALRDPNCEEVTIFYRRTREEMPAFEEEIEAFLEEGIKVQFLTAPIRIVTKNGKMVGLECIRMELGEPDDSGRRRPVPVVESEHVVDLDTLLVAIGETPNVEFLKGSENIEYTGWESIVVNPETMQTGLEGVFAGGDAVTGPSVVIEAIAAGKLAAKMIDKYIRGESVEQDYELLRPSRYEPAYELSEEEVETAARPPHALINVEERVANFEEVALTLTEAQAVKEARRCMRCDLATNDGQMALEALQKIRSV